MLLRQYDPDYIVIEMSGEGDPSPVIRELKTLKPLIDLTHHIGIVDLTLAPNTLICDHITRNVFLRADLLVLNKRDLSSPTQISAWRALISRMNPAAEELETSHGVIDSAILLRDVRRRQRPMGLDGLLHQHRHQMLASYCFRTDREIDLARITRIMDQHGENFVRVKGFVRISGCVHEFQAVRGRWSLTPFGGRLADSGTRIVFLSRQLTKQDMHALCELYFHIGGGGSS
jgi:G3E family GTPase